MDRQLTYIERRRAAEFPFPSIRERASSVCVIFSIGRPAQLPEPIRTSDGEAADKPQGIPSHLSRTSSRLGSSSRRWSEEAGLTRPRRSRSRGSADSPLDRVGEYDFRAPSPGRRRLAFGLSHGGSRGQVGLANADGSNPVQPTRLAEGGPDLRAADTTVAALMHGPGCVFNCRRCRDIFGQREARPNRRFRYS